MFLINWISQKMIKQAQPKKRQFDPISAIQRHVNNYGFQLTYGRDGLNGRRYLTKLLEEGATPLYVAITMMLNSVCYNIRVAEWTLRENARLAKLQRETDSDSLRKMLKQMESKRTQNTRDIAYLLKSENEALDVIANSIMEDVEAPANSLTARDALIITESVHGIKSQPNEISDFHIGMGFLAKRKSPVEIEAHFVRKIEEHIFFDRKKGAYSLSFIEIQREASTRDQLD